MTAISIAVVWLVVGFVVAVLFGTAVRRTRREPDDDPALEQPGTQIRYLRKQRDGATDGARKHAVKRHAAA